MGRGRLEERGGDDVEGFGVLELGVRYLLASVRLRESGGLQRGGLQRAEVFVGDTGGDAAMEWPVIPSLERSM